MHVSDGTLKVVNPRLINGLTAALGMAVNPVATARFPKGSVFLCTGGSPLADAAGNKITDPARLTSKMVIFDTDGKVLGEIPWSQGSTLAEITGGPPRFRTPLTSTATETSTSSTPGWPAATPGS